MHKAAHKAYVLLVCVLLLAAGVRADTGKSPLNVTMCITYNVGCSFQLGFAAATYYAPRFAHIKPTVKYLGMYEAVPTPRGAALALAANGSDCDVYLGPMSSSAAQAINGLVNSMWMAGGVTANELSDRVNYPLFSRAAPTADVNQGPIAKFMALLGWTAISVLCSDNSYGQAATAGITSQLKAVGGTVYAAKCVSSNAPYATVEAQVQSALDSPSRVLFVAGGAGDASLVQGATAINTLDPDRSKLIVVFAEAACAGSDVSWKTVAGAFCASFSANETAYSAFYASFLARDTSDEKGQFSALGIPYPKTANTVSGYCGLGIDAARLTLQAMDSWAQNHTSLPSPAAVAVAWLRNQTLPDGLVGPLAIPNGDRVTPFSMRIRNVVDNMTQNTVANVSFDGQLSVAAALFVFNQYVPVDQVPTAIVSLSNSDGATAWWWVFVLVGALLMVGAVLPFGYHLHRRRLLAVRPLDSSKPFAVMFVGVKNMDALQDAGESNAAAALAEIGSQMRAAVRGSGCYEARRVDESTVMIVAHHPVHLVHCASQLLVSLDRVDWSSVMVYDLDAHRRTHHPALDVESQVNSKRSRRSRTSTSASLGPRSAYVHRPRETDEISSDTRSKHRGGRNKLVEAAVPPVPALQIGLHYGMGVVDHNEALNTVSYVGKVVMCAAELADAADADQILVSRESLEAIEMDKATPWQPWGTFQPIDDARISTTVALGGSVFVPSELSHRVVPVEHGRMSNRSSEPMHGAIAAALQRADAGLCLRRIGVACIKVPALLALSDTRVVSIAATLLEKAATIAAAQRGEIHALTNGSLLVTVNARVPAAQPVARAALIALDVMNYLTQEQLTGTAGIAGGTALVGCPAKVGAFAALGPVAGLAEVAQQMAEAHGVSICAVDTDSYDDLVSRLHAVTVDVVPNAAARHGVSRLLAILAARESTAGEWLYTTGTNTFPGLKANEDAWRLLVDTMRCPDEDTLAAELEALPSLPWQHACQVAQAQLRRHSTLLADAQPSPHNSDNFQDEVARFHFADSVKHHARMTRAL